MGIGRTTIVTSLGALTATIGTSVVPQAVLAVYAAFAQSAKVKVGLMLPYTGTYAALGSGMIGGYAQNNQVETDFQWPSTQAAAEVIQRRCSGCHQKDRPLPKAFSDELDVSFWRFELTDVRLRLSRHYVYNLSRPEKSLLLLAPLSKNAGGFGLCDTNNPQGVFASASDPDYQKLLAMTTAGRDRLAQLKRFDMEGFRPRPEWVREMRHYGVLLPNARPSEVADVYAVEQKYWRSLWYEAKRFPGAGAGRPDGP